MEHGASTPLLPKLQYLITVILTIKKTIKTKPKRRFCTLSVLNGGKQVVLTNVL